MKLRIVVIAGIFIAATTAFPFSASGTTITAASCSQSAVQSAVNQAQNGDTVIVPSGPCTWNGAVTLSNSKGVSLMCQTAGSCNITVGGGQAVLMDSLTGVNNNFYRISGFTFQGGSGFIIWFAGNSDSTPDTLSSIRVDHNTFNAAPGAIAVFFGHTQGIANYYGVIDHNTLSSTGNVMLVQMIGNTNNTPPPSQTGTANNMFVEDNTITITTMTNAGHGCTDSWGNGALVFRHNTTTNCLVTSHGVPHSGGPQNFELYDNNIRVDSGAEAAGFGGCYRCFHHQGSGEFMAFNNSFTAFSTKSTDPLEMTHYRSATPAVAGYNTSLGRCDGTSSRDGNRSPSSIYFGYPCWRQPGRDFAGNLKPMYVWNNRWSDTGARISMLVANPWSSISPGVEDHIKPERDYYNAVSASAQTSPSAPFNGTTGMGFGLLANRPTTCTTGAEPLDAGKGGVGYWATDTNTLYRCSAANTWTAHYQPYIYPHPLTAAPMQIGTASLANAVRLRYYDQTLQASGGSGSYVWSVSSGSLPPGLQLDAATGIIRGRVRVKGTWSFTLTVRDAQNAPATASQSFTVASRLFT